MRRSPLSLRRGLPVVLVAGLLVAGVGCGGSGSDVFGSDDGGGGSGGGPTGGPSGPGAGSTTTTAAGTPTSTSASTDAGPTTTTGGSQGSTGPGGGGGEPCTSGPDDDADGDGSTPSSGDCNDCDPAVGPGASEVAANGADDDCDGLVDEEGACDDGLPVDDGDPLTAVQALGICATASDDGFGLVDAQWVRANGSGALQGLQGGVLADFGPNVPPLEGERVLALSSGHARLPGTAGACGSETCSINQAGTPPPGFPQSVAGCPAANPAIDDDIGLEVTLRAPANATGYRYRFRFYSFEFPEYVCTEFTDQFVVLATPAPVGASNGNLSAFSSLPMSVNVPIAACSSCEPWAEQCLSAQLFDPEVECPNVPSPCCPDGDSALSGTGFDQWATAGAGATAWLETRAPITGGDEVTLRFAIWDTGDSALDSTVVLDDFAWLSEPGVTLETVRVAE